MLRIAKSEVQRARLDSSAFWIAMAGEHLALKSGSVKFIYGHSILHHLHLEAALREISRVLQD